MIPGIPAFASLPGLAPDALIELLAATLLHSLWQGGILSVLLMIALRQMKRATPQRRYAVSCVTLALLAATPIVTFHHLASRTDRVLDRSWSVADAREATGADHGLTAPPASMLIGTALPQKAGSRIHLESPGSASERVWSWESAATRIEKWMQAWTWTWKSWLVLVWLTGIVLCSLRHLLGWLGLHTLRTQGTSPAPEAVVAALQETQRVMGIRRRVTVLCSDRISGPVAMGCLKLLILVPVSLATRLPMAQWEMILAHELAHLRRHDYLVNLLQAAVESLLFYHPAVWWINRQIRREREHACDDAAVLVTRDRGAYALALVHLAELQMEWQQGRCTGKNAASAKLPDLALAAARRPGDLRQRIQRLLTAESFAPTGLRTLPGLALCLAILVLLVAPGVPRQSQAQEPLEEAPPKRGEIRDRRGVVVALDDRPDRQLVFRLPAVVEAWQKVHGAELPMVEFEYTNAKNVKAMGRRVNIVAIFDEMAAKPIQESGLSADYNAGQLRAHYGASTRDQEDGFVLRSELSVEDYEKAKTLVDTVPAMEVRTRYLRRYPYAALAGHVVGYVKRPAPASTSALAPHNPYSQGASGAEKAWNRELTPAPPGTGHGTEGAGTDERGQPHGRSGAHVQLTLDMRHQYIVERTLRDAGVGRGAAVLIDVKSGDVLAMASLPSYDPNHFVPSITQAQYKSYRDDPTGPLTNRAVRGYAPGAPFMAVTGLAGVMSGREEAVHECNGALEVGSRTFNCWIQAKSGTHGPQTLDEALANGCGFYFYELVLSMGYEEVEKTAGLLGLGRKSGIGLWEEASGTIPGPAWVQREKLAKKRPRLDSWTPAYSCIAAVGQGVTEVTPLQMTNVFASLANGGTVWRPGLLDGFEVFSPVPENSSGTKRSIQHQPRVRAEDLRKHGLTDAGLKRLKTGFERRSEVLELATDTMKIVGFRGVVQNWRKDELSRVFVKDNAAWLVCYAPSDNPRWALTVLVKNGTATTGSETTVARRIMDQVAAVENGTLEVAVLPLAPAKGHFLEPTGFP
jgi:penicillin-binding protein 2